MGQKQFSSELEKPDIFIYHDVLIYLKDWLDYQNCINTRFSLRKFAAALGVDHSYISRLLRGNAPLTERVALSMVKAMRLNTEEKSFFNSLRSLSEANNQYERVRAFKRLMKNRRFKNRNQSDLMEHEYLSKWYYPVIRELVKLPSFQADTKWIRKKLNRRLSNKEIEAALQFLIKNGYVRETNGKLEVAKKQITCTGGIYRLAASEYHSQLLEEASNSIHDVDRQYRQIMAHTLAMPKDKVSEVRDILNKAVIDIIDLDMPAKDKDSVYQISLLAFPLTDINDGESSE